MTINKKGGMNGVSLKMPQFPPNGATMGASGATMRPLSAYSLANTHRPAGLFEAEDNSKDEFIQPIIYPNPSKGNFFVQNLPSSGGLVDIFDLAGRRLQSLQINSDEEEVRCNLPHGIYIVKISCLTKTFSRRLVIE
jgi:hypothetical protein